MSLIAFSPFIEESSGPWRVDRLYRTVLKSLSGILQSVKNLFQDCSVTAKGVYERMRTILDFAVVGFLSMSEKRREIDEGLT